MRLLSGHEGTVNSLAYRPDGKLLASGGSDGAIIFWNLLPSPDEHPARKVAAHANHVALIAFAPDGGVLASASWDGSAAVWDPDAGEERLRIKDLPGQEGSMIGVAVSPDSRRLAFAGGRANHPNPILIADLRSGQLLHSLFGHEHQVGVLVYPPPVRPELANLFISGSADRTVRLWDLRTGEAYARLVHRSFVQSIVVSPDGRTMATTGGEHIRLWDLPPTGDPNRLPPVSSSRATLAGHRTTVKCLAFAPDGRTLASVGEDGTVRFWDVAAQRCRSTIDAKAGSLHAVAFAPDGLTVAIAGDNGFLALLDVDG